MPVQLFPPEQKATEKRKKRSWLKWLLLMPIVLLFLFVLIPLAVGALTPVFLLNTDVGRTILRGAASSTDDAHLSLGSSELSFSPNVSLELAQLKIVRPYEPQAPVLTMKRMALLDLSIESNLPGMPLICKQAILSGFDIEVNQRWIQLNQGDGKPPQLPEYFPKKIITHEVKVEDTNYTVHQYQHGRPTRMRLSGIQASLTDFRWDLQRMHIQGQGPFQAETLALNGMIFHDMQVPDFKADGNHIIFPKGHLKGLGGTVDLSGELVIQRGVPIPSFDIQANALDLGTVILANPDAPKTDATPSGVLYLSGRSTASPPQRVGEVPEPIIEGELRIEKFTLPIVNKGPMVNRVLKRIPGYVAGDIPRLMLGTLSGNVRVADGRVRLKRLRVKLGGRYVMIDGQIEQASGRLDLKLWSESESKMEEALAEVPEDGEGEDQDSSTGEEGTQPPDQENSTRGDGAASAPAKAQRLEQAGESLANTAKSSEQAGETSAQDTGSAPSEASEESQSAATPEATPVPTNPESEVSEVAAGGEDDEKQPHGLRGKLRAIHEKNMRKAKEIKDKLDSKAAEAKKKVEEKLEDAREDLKAKAEERREARQEKAEEIAQKLKAAKEKARKRHQARVNKVKNFVESKKSKIRSRLEEKLGRPMICIRGTTQNPKIELCTSD